MDLGRVDRQAGWSALSNVSVISAEFIGPRVPRAVEDDVGHLLAAQALDALLAEHPLDGVDDVRLARAVRPHHDRDPGRKLEPGLFGEALETDEFERFEHRGGISREEIGNVGRAAFLTNREVLAQSHARSRFAKKPGASHFAPETPREAKLAHSSHFSHFPISFGGDPLF